MKIVILAMDDPVYTNKFIRQIIDARRDDIAKVVQVTGGNRLTLENNRSKIAYLFSLLLIMGPVFFIKNALLTVIHQLQKTISRIFPGVDGPRVVDYAASLSIDTLIIADPNDLDFIRSLQDLEPDLIINQSQCILKKELLDVSRLGTLNRHNSLLPKNRGRLTPFWVLYKGEPSTGVSIHFVEEDIDSGDILVQKSFSINSNDTFKDVVERNYQLAGEAMLEALGKIESGEYTLIENDDEQATYNTTPTIHEALEYRMKRIF